MKQEVAAPPPALVRPRPWFQSGKFLLFLAGLAAVYAYGWRVTNIDLPELVTGAKFVRPFVRDLVRPDVLTRATQSQQAERAMSVDPAVPPETLPPSPGSSAANPTSSSSARARRPPRRGCSSWSRKPGASCR
jgi:hypothetical protein